MTKPLSDYPWFRFSVAQFIRATRGMSNDETGRYINGIVDAWIDNRPDDLPQWVRDAATERLHKSTIYSGNAKAIAGQLHSNCQAISSHILSSLSSSASSSLGFGIKGGAGGEGSDPPAATPVPPGWRDSYEVYRQQALEAQGVLLADEVWLETRRRYHPNIDLRLSVEKCFADFWALEAGWKHKKKGKASTIDWPATIANALTMKMNQVEHRRPRVV